MGCKRPCSRKHVMIFQALFRALYCRLHRRWPWGRGDSRVPFFNRARYLRLHSMFSGGWLSDMTECTALFRQTRKLYPSDIFSFFSALKLTLFCVLGESVSCEGADFVRFFLLCYHDRCCVETDCSGGPFPPPVFANKFPSVGQQVKVHLLPFQNPRALL